MDHTESIEFSRPEYWSGQPFPSPGDLPNPGMELRSPVLQADSLPVEPQGKPNAEFSMRQLIKQTHQEVFCCPLLSASKRHENHVKRVALVVKNPPAKSIPGLGRCPGGTQWQPTPVFLSGKSHGQRSLAGYSLWGHKEQDTTKATQHARKLCKN